MGSGEANLLTTLWSSKCKQSGEKIMTQLIWEENRESTGTHEDARLMNAKMGAII